MQNQNILSKNQSDKIIEAFKLCDLDGDGLIDYDELKMVMKTLGFKCTGEEIMEILGEYGQQPQGFWDRSFGSEGVSLVDISDAFDLFDQHGKGSIDIDDLRTVAQELGKSIEEEELGAMIEILDVDGDGHISRKDLSDRIWGRGAMILSLESFQTLMERIAARNTLQNVCVYLLLACIRAFWQPVLSFE